MNISAASSPSPGERGPCDRNRPWRVGAVRLYDSRKLRRVHETKERLYPVTWRLSVAMTGVRVMGRSTQTAGQSPFLRYLRHRARWRNFRRRRAGFPASAPPPAAEAPPAAPAPGAPKAPRARSGRRTAGSSDRRRLVRPDEAGRRHRPSTRSRCRSPARAMETEYPELNCTGKLTRIGSSIELRVLHRDHRRQRPRRQGRTLPGRLDHGGAQW